MDSKENTQLQMDMETAERLSTMEPTVGSLMEQLNIIDRYIYTAKKQVRQLGFKDATSVSYQFAVGLLETLMGFRAGIIAEYCADVMGQVSSEHIGVLMEHIDKKVKALKNGKIDIS